MRSRRLLLALGSLAVGHMAFAEAPVGPPRVSVETTKLGAPFTVDVAIPGGAKVDWHAKPLPEGSPFSLLGQHVTQSQGGADLQLQVGLYALGAQTLPSLNLVSSTGKEFVVPVTAQVTGVSDLGTGKLELRPLAGPVVPEVFAWRWLLATGGLILLAAALLAFALTRIIRWRASAERRDRRALEKLLGSPCTDLEFYLQLDGIVRRHLERRHGIPAPERTSTELSAAVSAQPALPATELVQLFREADLVKFAERPAGPGRRDADGAMVLRLVTQPRPSPGAPHVPSAL